MKKVKLGRHSLEIYDSIDELPMARYHKLSKFMLIDAHIGSEIADFDIRAEKIIQYIRTNKPDLAEKELMNMRQNVHFIQTGVSPKDMAFAVLVHKLDGKLIDDISEESLKRVCDALGDVPAGQMMTTIEASKKKLDDELKQYFPALFDSSSVKEYYSKLKRRTLLVLEKLVNGKLTPEQEKELNNLTIEIELFCEPACFSGPESLEIQQDKQYESACLIISQSTGANPKAFTVLEYFNALMFIREQNKKQSKRK